VQYYPGNTQEAREQMRKKASALYKQTGKPILIPDIGNWTPTKLNPQRDMDGVETQAARGQHYVDTFT
jgi:hypothetical protein